MSFFQNPEKLLKKHYIIHSLASAGAIFAGLLLCFVVHGRALHGCEHYAVVCKVAAKVARMVGKLGKSFWAILVWMFFGDVLKKLVDMDSNYFEYINVYKHIYSTMYKYA
jgi:hypothetical protein